MFTTSKTRELTREIEELKAQLAALKQQGPRPGPRRVRPGAWGTKRAKSSATPSACKSSATG